MSDLVRSAFFENAYIFLETACVTCLVHFEKEGDIIIIKN